jgi:hypothetical protein
LLLQVKKAKRICFPNKYYLAFGMKIILPCLLLAVSIPLTPAWGRLGETGDELVARYGQPLSEMDQKAEGNHVPLAELVFQKNGFEIDVSLSDGISSAESFRKLNGDSISLAEARILLTANSQGSGWEAPQTVGDNKEWGRDDGAVATLVGGRILSIKSKDLLDKEAAAKKLVSTPSLDGF